MKIRNPPNDGLGVEIDDDAIYYLQDTRQTVGNCMLFWCPQDEGYTCQLDDAGKYTGKDARSRCNDGTHKAWPVGFIERNAVRHVRADSIDVRLRAIGRGFRRATMPRKTTKPAPPAKASGIGEERTLIIDMIESMLASTDALDGFDAADTAEHIIACIRSGLHRKDFGQ